VTAEANADSAHDQPLASHGGATLRAAMTLRAVASGATATKGTAA